MDTILELRSVNRVLQLFGLSVTQFSTFKYIPLHRFIKHYSILLIALRLIMFCYISIKYQISADNDDTMHSTLDTSTIFSAHLLEIFILAEAFAKARLEETCMENFLEIDHILMQRFNIELKNGKQRRSAVYRLIIWLCVITVDFSVSLAINYNTAYFPHETIETLSLLTASLTYFQIFTWADLIWYRMRIVNRLLNDLKCNHNEQIENQEMGKTPQVSLESNELVKQMMYYDQNNETDDAINDTYIFDQFCAIGDLYHRLWMQTNLLNQRFKFSMVLNIGNDFAYLVTQLYFIFMCLRKLDTCNVFAADFSMCLLNLFHLAMISKAGQNLADEAAKVSRAIHRNKFIRSSEKLNSFVSPHSTNCSCFPRQPIELRISVNLFRFDNFLFNCFIKLYNSMRLSSLMLIIHSFLR